MEIACEFQLVLPYVFLMAVLPVHGQVRGDWMRPCWSAGPVVPESDLQIINAKTRTGALLRDPTLRQDFWDPIKYIRLRNHPDDWYVSLGGWTRQDFERIGNDNWGQQPYPERILSPTVYGFTPIFITASTFARLFN